MTHSEANKALALATTVNAQVVGKPAFELRGDHFGDPPPKKKVFSDLICAEEKTIPGATYCGRTSGDPIVGVNLNSVIHSYLDGKLYAVDLGYSSDSYSRIVEVFSIKYGKPDSVYTTPGQTAVPKRNIAMALLGWDDGDKKVCRDYRQGRSISHELRRARRI